MISYKYNIYKSKNTKHLDKMLKECAFVWNHALNLQKRYYRRFEKYISIGKLKKHLIPNMNIRSFIGDVADEVKLADQMKKGTSTKTIIKSYILLL